MVERPQARYSHEPEEGEETNNGQGDPVSQCKDHDSLLHLWRLSAEFLSFIDPSDAHSLEHANEEHEVDVEVVVNDIEVCETPVE